MLSKNSNLQLTLFLGRGKKNKMACLLLLQKFEFKKKKLNKTSYFITSDEVSFVQRFASPERIFLNSGK
ncbi:MAG: hypothetical protein DRO63_07620 [Candidatus Gerdarchaeota archaeon]|nr:MAG: hypothetical protein DRO63_07620 [Candidatus Gerdarchaeota archaeon]